MSVYIYTRQQWGARPPQSAYRPYRPTAVVFHHTFQPGCGLYGPESEAALQRQMQASHMARGWGDIGQHFTVFQSGRVYEGRPLSARGVHAAGANSWTIGIEHQGDFHTSAGCSMPEAQMRASAKLIAYIFKVMGWPTTSGSIDQRVIPHRRLSSTACPGDRGIKAMNQVKGFVVRYLERLEDQMSRSFVPIRFDSTRPQIVHAYFGRAYDRRYIHWLHVWRYSGPQKVRFHIAVFAENAASLDLENAVDRRWLEFSGVGATWALHDIYANLSGNYLIVFTSEPQMPAFEGNLEEIAL